MKDANLSPATPPPVAHGLPPTPGEGWCLSRLRLRLRPMARRGGLGPQGHTAVRRAAQTWKELQAGTPPRVRSDRGRVSRGVPEHVNPAVTSHTDPGEQEVEKELQWYDFDSSRVNQAAYDSKTKQLFVNFVRPTPGWDEYVYEGVESNEWRNFRRSQSPGKFINRVLNSKNYHRVN